MAMKLVRFLAGGLLALSVGAVPLLAQSPADRATIDSFRTTLTADSDTAQILGILAATRARAEAASKDAVVRTELGWALLRAGQLLKSADTLYTAADEFYHAVERQRHWPYPWYGLGETKIALELQGARVRPSVHQVAGAAWIQSAGIAFTEALKGDSGYHAAAVALAQATLQNNFDPQSGKALALLEPLLDTANGAPGPFLLLGRLDRRLDSFPKALAAFETYLRRGGDSGIALLEAARTLYGLDRAEAAESTYWAGAAAARSLEAVGLYREDISYIADSMELKNFDSTAAKGLSDWLRTFWDRRDAASGQRSGHRLAEHYRRWAYALKHYPSWARIQQYGFLNIFRHGISPFDDRGIIYVRHGPPDRVASFASAHSPPNESWLYFRSAGNLVLNFTAGATSGWKLTEGLSGAPSTSYPEERAEFYSSRIDFGPIYMRLAMRAEMDAGRAQLQHGFAMARLPAPGNVTDLTLTQVELNEERLASRRSIQLATRTDSDPLRYVRSLAPIIQVYGAGSDVTDEARLLLVYALPIPADFPVRILPDSSVVYALRLRFLAADSTGHLRVNTDSIRLIHAPHPLRRGESLSGLAVFAGPAGDYHLKVMLSDTADSVGAGWAIAEVPAPALDGPALTLSDPILGRAGSGLSWVRPDGTIPLNPLNLVSAGRPITLSYEMGGLTRGGTYRTRVTIRKFGTDTTKNLVAVEIPAVATDTRMLVTKEISLSGVKPGRYLLTVAVSDGSATVERTRRVVVSR